MSARFLFFLICILNTCYAECRNSESCGSVKTCIRCEEPTQGKHAGNIAIMSKSSYPVKIYNNQDLSACIPCSCGDTMRDEGEECDDGNNNSSDGCSAACIEEFCGDGYVNLPGEECDDGNKNNEDNCICSADAIPVGKYAKCGDAFVNHIVEECDSGSNNGKPGFACSKDCKFDICLGNADSIRSLCGNSKIDCDEECDDGNSTDDDECTNQCKNNNKCLYVAAWNNYSGAISEDTTNSDFYNQSLDKIYKHFKYTVEKHDVPGCFNNLVGKFSTRDLENGKVYGLRTLTTAYTLRDFLGAPANSSIYTPCGTMLNGTVNICGVSYYMDENCKYVSAKTVPEGTKMCGFAGVSWSPISLIIDETKSLDQDMRVVDFSLDPNNPQGYSLWKASASAPLLVYDPNKTGKVESVNQLFGNWTFGGQQENISKTSLSKHFSKKPWGNGYEALATLDLDHNSKIDGTELNTLALWFDENRDAKVDTNELRSLKSEQITALFYKDPDTRDPKNLRLAVGFEKSLKGTIVRGASVDWFAETFSSQNEALSALAVIFKNEPKLISNTNNPLDFAPHLVSEHIKDVSGYWKWELTDKYGDLHPGFLALEQTKDGEIHGYSIIETQLSKNKMNLRSGVQILPLSGKAVRDEFGITNLELTINMPELNTSVHSNIILMKNGISLTGKSTQKLSDESNKKSASMEYAWKATKVIDKL